MSDDSEVVLRWTNKTTRESDGKYEGVFNELGFKWTVLIDQRTSSSTERVPFTFSCDVDHNGPWKCNAIICVTAIHPAGGTHWFGTIPASFSDNQRTCTRDTDQFAHVLARVCIEIKIKVISSERGKPIADLGKFGAPNNRSNVILKIEDVKLHVSKEFLAVHSPVFETMFFGDFTEKDKEEVEIKDVVYEEFLDLLRVIYPGSIEITDLTVMHILKLADRFQMERVLDQSLKHLTQSTGFDALTKLLVADQYRFASLKEQCLKSFTSSNDLVEKIKSFPEYDKFSGEMKIAICDRIAKL